jgi:hypothetical protein
MSRASRDLSNATPQTSLHLRCQIKMSSNLNDIPATKAELQQLRQEILHKLDELNLPSLPVPKPTDPSTGKAKSSNSATLQPLKLISPIEAFLCSSPSVKNLKYGIDRPSIMDMNLSHLFKQSHYSM